MVRLAEWKNDQIDPQGTYDLISDAINIFPNPAQYVLMVDLAAYNGNFNQVRIKNT